MYKNREVWNLVFWDIRTNRQTDRPTDRHTDTLIAILRTPPCMRRSNKRKVCIEILLSVPSPTFMLFWAFASIFLSVILSNYKLYYCRAALLFWAAVSVFMRPCCPARLACIDVHVFIVVWANKSLIDWLIDWFIAHVRRFLLYGRPMQQMGTLYFCLLVSSSFFFLSIFFLACSQPSQTGCLPYYFHTCMALVRI